MAAANPALRRAAIPETITYPDDLPITAWRDELLDAIGNHQVVVVAGETGSGKSTQLPKLCLEAGRGRDGVIGHTQPRRIAARSIAERVAEELGSTVGGLVGYAVRFTDEVGPSTAVKVMTDGILLNELHRDPLLRRYDTLIIDEAHERTLNVDFLLGYLHRILPRRPDLKVVITSATIDTERFSEHFGGAPVVEVAGRGYPVEIRYRSPMDEPDQPDQPEAIGRAVEELAAEGTGDILVFCSGEREIRDAVDAISDLDLRHTETIPLFGRLSVAEQHRVFAPHTGRRIVVATNVAETSLTVPGITAVVDAGTARISRYSRRTKVQQLPIEPISQASADQRAGRCGRIAPGVCIRLYDEADYESRPEFTEPEILRTNLAAVMLRMASIGLGEVESFPFLDPPDTRSIRDGVALLEEIGAVHPGAEGTTAWLTEVGRTLARIPVDPRLGRMIVAGNSHACLDEALTIVSALAIQDPRERPTGQEEAADQRHRRFMDDRSDLLSWLRLWAHVRTSRKEKTSGQFRRMCRDEFLNPRRVREWQDVRAQLRRVAKDLGMHPNRKPADPALVHEALLTGLLSHVGRRDPDGWEYRGARGTRFAIRPGSTLFKRAPEWVMAAELTETTRTWATGVAPVDPDTVARVGEHLVKRSLSDPWWDARRGAVVAAETVTLYGIPLITDRTVMYERHDPAVAHDLFIRHALVAGEWDADHAFVGNNRDRIEEVAAIEVRERRRDLLVTDDTLAAWFAERVPSEVASTRSFDAWWKEARVADPNLLDLTVDDLIAPEAPPIDPEAFPEEWAHGDIRLPLHYTFDTHNPDDGVTVDVPLAALDRLDPAAFAWNVPGLRVDLVEALLRTLPKRLRRRCTPIADRAGELAARIDPSSGDVVASVARELSRDLGEIVPPDAFDEERVPEHLRPHFRVVTSDGEVLAAGSDLVVLRDALREEARAAVGATAHPIEREGITRWDFGRLPDRVTVGDGGHAVAAYPGIVDEGESVSIRLLATEGERDEATWRGIRRLVILDLASPRKLQQGVLGAHGGLAIVGSPYADAAAWMDDCLACAIDAVHTASGIAVVDEDAFEALMDAMQDDLAETLDRVGSDAAGALDSLRRARTAVDASGEVFPDAAADVEGQIDRFVFPGFLTAVGAGRVDDVRRYLDGAAYRLGRIAEDPERDRSLMAQVRALEDEHDRLTEVLPWTEDLVAIAWMLQELRMSLFAQSLGVSGPVSAKRVRAALDALLT